jgi:hypothetical protein
VIDVEAAGLAGIVVAGVPAPAGECAVETDRRHLDSLLDQELLTGVIAVSVRTDPAAETSQPVIGRPDLRGDRQGGRRTAELMTALRNS